MSEPLLLAGVALIKVIQRVAHLNDEADLTEDVTTAWQELARFLNGRSHDAIGAKIAKRLYDRLQQPMGKDLETELRGTAEDVRRLLTELLNDSNALLLARRDPQGFRRHVMERGGETQLAWTSEHASPFFKEVLEAASLEFAALAPSSEDYVPAALDELHGLLERHEEAAAARHQELRARSPYLRTIVAEWIPHDGLKGRDDDLSTMRQFATGAAPDQALDLAASDRYLVWEADSWSGKTALMASFALDPPNGVDVVAFFITRQYAHQHDRGGFLPVVCEQLAERLERPPRPFDPSVQEAHFRNLLAEAARRSQAAGRRLILLVDGLDEDRGWKVSNRRYSIAALLPPKTEYGMRVIVSRRPHPPVPDDVSSSHPLHDQTVVRHLTPSPDAQVRRHVAEHELADLLAGKLSRRIVGLIMAAGGGLTADDLAELTGCTPQRITRMLQTSMGRSLRSRSSALNLAVLHPGWMLAHSTLIDIAAQELDRSLPRYRDRIAAWVRGYQESGWPPHTPLYLLDEYPSQAEAIAGRQHLVELVLDPQRHHRLHELAGSNTLAIRQIDAVQHAVTRDPTPDLRDVFRLAIAREKLQRHTPQLPADVALTWAHLGQYTAAAVLVASDPKQAARTLSEIARVAAAAGATQPAVHLVALATEAADAVSGPQGKAAALCAVAVAASSLEDTGMSARLLRRARTVINALETDAQARSLGVVAKAAARTRQWQLAQDVSQSISDPDFQIQAYITVAREMARAGDWSRAHEMVDSLPLDRHVQGQLSLARVAAAEGKWDLATTLAEQSGPEAVVSVLLVSARAAAREGEPAHTRRMLEAALRRSEEVQRPEESSLSSRPQYCCQIDIADTAAELGVFDLAHRALQTARTLPLGGFAEFMNRWQGTRPPPTTGPKWIPQIRDLMDDLVSADILMVCQDLFGSLDRHVLTARVAAGAAARNEVSLASALFEDAQQAAKRKTGFWQGNSALDQVADVAAQAGHWDTALDLAAAITEPQQRTLTLARTARMAAAAGDVSQARQILQTVADTAPTSADPARRASYHLQDVVEALAEEGHFRLARRIANQLHDDDTHKFLSVPHRSKALSVVVAAAAKAGETHLAGKIARTIADPTCRAKGLADISWALAQTGDWRKALDTAETSPSLLDRALARYDVSRVAAHRGKWAEAQEIASSVQVPMVQVWALCNTASQAQDSGEREVAAVMLQAAVTVVRDRPPTGVSGTELVTVARVAAYLDDRTTTRELLDYTRDSLGDRDSFFDYRPSRPAALARLAAAAAQVGETDWARRTLNTARDTTETLSIRPALVSGFKSDVEEIAEAYGALEDPDGGLHVLAEAREDIQTHGWTPQAHEELGRLAVAAYSLGEPTWAHCTLTLAVASALTAEPIVDGEPPHAPSPDSSTTSSGLLAPPSGTGIREMMQTQSIDGKLHDVVKAAIACHEWDLASEVSRATSNSTMPDGLWGAYAETAAAAHQWQIATAGCRAIADPDHRDKAWAEVSGAAAAARKWHVATRGVGHILDPGRRVDGLLRLADAATHSAKPRKMQKYLLEAQQESAKIAAPDRQSQAWLDIADRCEDAPTLATQLIADAATNGPWVAALALALIVDPRTLEFAELLAREGAKSGSVVYDGDPPRSFSRR